ncbi:hypothetical protein [Reinekea sp. G2M2-21]|uniref:hypothetical protein n=1 Tax=Reinekea sp. G2M2-21 TaxID=2788942 RepID=UPI0018AB5242|nr:hypothetical protein [Reinekea sp. G2M2-21]
MSRILSLPLALWVSVLLFLSLGTSFFSFEVAGARVYIFDLIAVFLLLYFLLQCGSVRLKAYNIRMLLGVYFYIALLISLPLFVSVLNNEQVSGVLLTSARFFLLSILILLAPILVSESYDIQLVFYNCLGFMIALNFIYGLLQLLEFQNVIPYGVLPHHWVYSDNEWFKFDDWGRSSGLLKGPNELGWFGVIAFSLVLAKYIQKSTLLNLVMLLMAASLPFVSNSRSAILGLIIAYITSLILVVIFLFASRNSSLSRMYFKYLLLFVPIGAGAVGMAWLFFDYLKIDRLWSGVVSVLGLEEDTSLSGRLDMWQGVVSLLNQNNGWLFGLGVNPDSLFGAVDSGWLSYIVKGGLVLAFTFFIVLLVLFIQSILIFRKTRKPFFLGVSLVWVAVIVGLFFVEVQHFSSILLLYVAYSMVLADCHKRG